MATNNEENKNSLEEENAALKKDILKKEEEIKGLMEQASNQEGALKSKIDKNKIMVMYSNGETIQLINNDNGKKLAVAYKKKKANGDLRISKVLEPGKAKL